MKKVIAAMTVGKDVSVLFPDVVKCMQTPNIELKKLVYLYLINYAKSQPDLAILAVNTFVKVRRTLERRVAGRRRAGGGGAAEQRRGMSNQRRRAVLTHPWCIRPRRTRPI